MEDTYNGWTNRATWNVSLWLNNDNGLYKNLCILVRRHDNAIELAKAIQDWCEEELWPNGLTPDGDPLAQVNWLEIADG